MARIAFIGLGNMGLPMARNLMAAGHEVSGFDVSTAAMDAFRAAGGAPASGAAECLAGAEAVVAMLPEGRHVREVFGGTVIPNAPAGALLVDCSTIDVDSARAVAAQAEAAGFDMVDAPVSGGVGGAEAGTLTFMVGGSAEGFARARPILEAMGGNIVHTGAAGTGQVAKICNNMILGSTMAVVCESFAMGEKLGVDPQTLFDIVSKSSGQCWAITTYCPVPGPVPTAPSSRDYRPGFTAAMMAKDLRLARGAARSAGQNARVGALASAMFDEFLGEDGAAELDCSAIYRKIAADRGV